MAFFEETDKPAECSGTFGELQIKIAIKGESLGGEFADIIKVSVRR